MSCLQQYLLSNHFTNVQEIQDAMAQKPYCIKVKHKNNHLLFMYDMIHSDFKLPIVQESRGIVLSFPTYQIVSRGFDKFFNYGESNAAQMDVDSVQFLEKLDGSIIKLSTSIGWSTNGTIDAKDARNGSDNKTFYDLIVECRGLEIDMSQLQTDHTYIFELRHPENRIVVESKEKALYFLGARNNKTGQQYSHRESISLGLPNWIQTPREFLEIKTLEQAKRYAVDYKTSDFEGFVAVDRHFNRVKVKTDLYVSMHHMVSSIMGPSELLQVWLKGEVAEVVVYMPSAEPKFRQLNDHLNACLDKIYRTYKSADKTTKKSYALHVMKEAKDTSAVLFALHSSLDTSSTDTTINNVEELKQFMLLNTSGKFDLKMWLTLLYNSVSS